MSIKQAAVVLIHVLFAGVVCAEGWRPIALHATTDHVQPMTGLVVWHDNEHAESDAIQLEFSYMLFNQAVNAEGDYDWSPVDELLDKIASRGHQAILRFRFIYPGYIETAVPDSIKRLPDYHEIIAKSEGRDTAFCDWSHPALKAFTLDFYTKFAERYDKDPRLAFVQVGFGLWAEYHIYDGPMELGKTFPDKAFQAEFFRHLADVFKHTPWSISIDAAEAERTPFAEQPDLLALSFGLFDDSFLHARHGEYNETCWNFFGRQRYINAPAGGEFSYYNNHDQLHALGPEGPNGESFERAAERFHITYMLANDQFRYQSKERIREAGTAIGYRFRVTAFETDGKQSRITLTNTGVAPIYYDAYPAINGVRSETSLRGLIPGEERVCEIACDGGAGAVTIECDRLVPRQTIQYDAELMGE